MPAKRPPRVQTRDQIVSFEASTDAGKERMITELARIVGNLGRQVASLTGGTLDVFTATEDGLAPASGGGASNYLRSDGAWSVPTGTVTLPLAQSNVTGLVSDLASKIEGSGADDTVAVWSGGDIVDVTAGSDGEVLTLVAGVPAWAPSSGGIGTGSLALQDIGTGGANFDSAATGTVDWAYPTGYGGFGDKPTWNSKRIGGWIRDSFIWSPGGSGAANDTRAWTNTWTAVDNALGNANSGTINLPGLNANSLNMGYSFRFPCQPTSRTLRWQGTQFGTDVTHTVQFSVAGLASPVSVTTVSTAVSGWDYSMECAFAGPLGVDLIVTSYVTTLHGANNHVYVGAIGVA